MNDRKTLIAEIDRILPRLPIKTVLVLYRLALTLNIP